MENEENSTQSVTFEIPPDLNPHRTRIRSTHGGKTYEREVRGSSPYGMTRYIIPRWRFRRCLDIFWRGLLFEVELLKPEVEPIGKDS